MGPPHSDECQQNLEVMLSSCRRLGVPVAPGKCAGPSTVMVFLGFELDTNLMVVRLPEEKLRRMAAMVRSWIGKKAYQKRDLESLLGHLQHAATVIRPGRTFVRRLIELLSAFQNREHWIRLNDTTRSDLCWCGCFMERWNGISLMPGTAQVPAPLVSDVSGSWGCGTYCGTRWFQWQWEGPSSEWVIAPKELLPILFALVVWGRRWAGCRIECYCDNMAVVAVINAGRVKDKTLMHLLRCMFFVAAHPDIQIHTNHVPGVENVAADALSRNRMSTFLQEVPAADPQPTAIPQALVDMTVMEQPDWTSPRWAQLFSAFCRRV